MNPRLILGAGLALLTAAPAAAQDFTWRGRLAADRHIEIRGVNGDVRAVRAQGNEVVVTATKQARRSDPESVRIEVVEHGRGVTICAVYPDRDNRRPNECRPGGGHMSTDRNDTEVDFTVQVPAGVAAHLITVNGNVDAAGLASNVYAVTVNGDVAVATSGWAEGRTVNGSITASMGRADWTGEMEFETVNGGITLELPAELHTEFEAQTVNGGIESDYPVTIQGRFGPRRVRGVLGSGGRELSLKTVNGSIRLKRRG